MSFRIAVALLLAASPAVAADGPKDNVPDNVRPIPPQGVTLIESDRAALETGLKQLHAAIAFAKTRVQDKPALLDLLPDVEVYEKAVRYAVEYGEFFNAKEIPVAKALLKQGSQRAAELAEGSPSWPTATGLVVRGYRSKIDGSVQPYGLVVPKSYDPKGTAKHRLDFWWHGRGETLSEVNFIDQRQRSPGEFTPEGAFVLHPYGRYCNANKFAGEIDTLECLEHAAKHYRIDEKRLLARGFSMGGAACWQFAVHYPTLWCAAAPGAGFAETKEFLNNFQGEAVKPTWWEQKLWHWYDATDSALNLYNLPTVAYSGEIDKQKQAADVMAREMKKVGLELTHIIGPKTGHSYEKGAKLEVARRIDEFAAKGRERFPESFRFTTYTLRYNKGPGVEIYGMKRHWEPARVEGTRKAKVVTVKTENVTRLWVEHDAPEDMLIVVLDGQRFTLDYAPQGTATRFSNFSLADGKWAHGESPRQEIVKKPGLQGPIDDAFLDTFLMVRPTGTPLNEQIGAWANSEMKHAATHWRSQFRGDAPVKDDTAVTDDDVKSANLVLWGDPSSNKVLAKIAEKLPVKWTKDGVTVGDKTYPAGTHVPVLIYPNPLNPMKYVVLNSGFTFREYDYLNNARQVPKLPDYAVIDVTTPPNSRWPGKVVRAGFFGERWELLPDDGK